METPANARLTGNPSPSNPDGASVTLFTGRTTAPAGAWTWGSTRLSGTVTAGMEASLPVANFADSR